MAKYTLLKNKVTGERRIYNSIDKTYTSEIDRPAEYMALRKRALGALKRAEKDDVMRSLGLTKVYGAVSGKVYWE